MCLREEPHPRVHVALAAQEQEERERQDGRKRGYEPCGPKGYLSGGQEEILEQLPELVPKGGELVAEPLEEPTEAVLLGDSPDIFRRPFGSLGRGDYEVDKGVDLIDQQGKKIPTMKSSPTNTPR